MNKSYAAVKAELLQDPAVRAAYEEAWVEELTSVKIDDVQIGTRYRRDMGDIESLAQSMNEIGLLHPVVLTPSLELIAGERRLLAARMLGWDIIPARVVDLENILRGEQHENAMRKDFTPSEAVAIGLALEPMEREAARERSGMRTDLEPAEKVSTGRALDKVAGAVGMSRPTYAKAKAVVEAAEQEPEKYGDLVEEMDSGSVSRAYNLLQDRQREDDAPASPTSGQNVLLIHGKMETKLPNLGQFDVIIADPPYNVTDWKWDKIGHLDFLRLTRLWLEVTKRALAEKYHLFWFCSPHYVADVELAIRELELPIQSRIIWHRRNMAKGSDAQNRFVDTWEMVFHIGNTGLIFPSAWDDSRFDVQTFAVPQTNFTDRKVHPTQKPLALYEWLLSYSASPSARILDPFAGGGTLGAASHGRECVLIEQEESYVREIEQRLRLRARPA